MTRDFVSQPPVLSRRSLTICGLLLALAYLPAWASYALNLWEREHYQFFPLAIAGAIFLARRALVGSRLDLAPSRPLALIFLAGALVVLGLATAFWSPWLAYISSLLLLVAFLAAVGGGRLLKALLPALIMLVILIRPPFNLDKDLAMWLRHVAVKLSTPLLDLARVPHFLSGVVIEIPWDRLLVEEACSGINSTFFVFAFGLFRGLMMKRHPLHIAFITLGGVSFVILGNVFRITLGAALRFHYGIDLLSGWPHETFGLALFLAYIGLITSLDLLTIRLLKGAAPLSNAAGAIRLPLARALTLLTEQALRVCSPRWLLPVTLLVLGFGAAQGYIAWQQLGASSRFVPSHLRPDAWFMLPDELGEWRNLGGQRPAGMQNYLQLEAIHSQVWAYRLDRLQCLVALSYPYRGFHDLADCYRGQGWTLAPPNFQTDGKSEEKTILEITMSKPPLNTGYLLYGAFTEDGQWQPPSPLQKRLGIRPGAVAELKTTYQVQLFTVSYAPLTPEEKAAARRLFLDAHALLRQQVMNQLLRAPAGAPASPK